MTRRINSNYFKAILFVAGLSLFYFDVLRIQLFDRDSIFYLSGLNLTFGSKLKFDNETTYTIKSDFYFSMLFIIHFIGILFCFIKTNWSKLIHLLISGAGIFILLLFQIKYLFHYKFSESDLAQTDFCAVYWILLLNLGIIGCLYFIEYKPKKAIENLEKTIININIITNSNNKST